MTSQTESSYDAVVVGAGPTGALVAHKLAANGLSVLILEAGDRFKGHNTLENTEANAGKIMWYEPRNHVGGDFVVPKTGVGVGGGTLSWLGVMPRFHRTDFRTYSTEGVGADWPIAYDDLRPHYERIEREFGVAGECGPFAPESYALPMPAHRMNWHAQVLARGAKQLGAHPFAPPVAINSVPRDDRPACIYCGWCASGCPTGGKNFMSHPTWQVFGTFDEPINAYKGMQMGHVMVQDYYKPQPDRGYARGYILVSYMMTPVTYGLLSGQTYGQEFKDFIYDYQHTAAWWAHAEGLPSESNTVTLDPELVDSHRLPVARVDYKWGDNDLKVAAAARDKAVEMMEASGARKMRIGLNYGAHAMGSCRMGNDPQTSVARSRLFVERSIYEEFVARISYMARSVRLGHGLNEETKMGPLVSRAQQQRVLNYIRIGREENASLAAGGKEMSPELAEGFFVPPTVFTGVDNSMRIAQEEIFGPVVCAIPFDDQIDAITKGNDSPFGLAAGIWTRDIRKAHQTAAALDVGTVWINCFNAFDNASPWGGFKLSGWGREKGPYGLDLFTQIKSVILNYT